MSIMKTCMICGKEFPCFLSRIRQGGGKYCSAECRDKSLKGNQFAKNHKPNATSFKKGIVPWNKNKHWPEEVKIKLSKSHLGQLAWNKGKTNIYSKETLEKIKSSKKGHIPWNKGLKNIYTEESIKKMSNARKGKSAWNAGLKGMYCGKENHNWKGGIEAYRKRKKSDLKYCISQRIASLIRAHLKKGSKGKRHWEILVGYTMKELISHLNNTMPKGYNWQDYIDGKLHLDHKIPVSAFNFDSPEQIDFMRCWALENLQLLPAVENMRKKDKITQVFQTALKI